MKFYKSNKGLFMTSVSFDESNCVNYQSQLETIQPSSMQPLRQIPQFLFENYNHLFINSYKPEQFQTLKEKVKTISSDDIFLETYDKDPITANSKKEEYDWIFALVRVEEVLKNIGNVDQAIQALTVDEFIKYNGYITRFTYPFYPGMLRQKFSYWRKKCDLNELFTINILHQRMANLNLTLSLSSLSTPGNSEKCELNPEDILSQLTSIKDNPQKVAADERAAQLMKERWEEFQPQKAMDSWLKEQNSNSPNLDIYGWLRKRVHYFPDPATIRSQLEEAIRFIQQTPNLHPIEKACYIWYKTIQIHIVADANKRTGRLIGSMILLAAGFLPPKISSADGKEYVAVLKQSFKEEQGHRRFTQYIVKLMLKTQNESQNENL